MDGSETGVDEGVGGVLCFTCKVSLHGLTWHWCIALRGPSVPAEGPSAFRSTEFSGGTEQRHWTLPGLLSAMPITYRPCLINMQYVIISAGISLKKMLPPFA